MEQPIKFSDIFEADFQKKLDDLIKSFSTDLEGAVEKAKADLLGFGETIKGLNPALEKDQKVIAEMSTNIENYASFVKKGEDALKSRAKVEKDFNVITERARIEERERRREITLTAQVNANFTGSLARMRAELALMTFQATKSKAAYQQLQPEISKLTDEIKKQESSMGNHTRNVGNYAGGIKAWFESIKGGAILVGGAIAIIGGILKKGVEGMMKFIERSEQGRDNMDQFKASMGAMFDATVSGMTKTAGGFSEWLNNTSSKLVSWGTNFNNKIRLAFANFSDKHFGTNLTEGAEAANSFADHVKEAGEKAKEATKKVDEMADAEIKLLVPRAKLNAQITAAREALTDENLSNAEKLKLLKTAISLEDELSRQEIQHAKDNWDNIIEVNKLKEDAGTLTREDKRKEAEAEAKLSDLENESSRRTLRSKRSILQLEKEIRKVREDNAKFENQISKLGSDFEVDSKQKVLDSQKDAQQAFDKWLKDDKKEIDDSIKQIEDEHFNRLQNQTEKEIKDKEEAEARKKKAAEESFQFAADFTDAYSQLIDQQKQNELSAAGDNAAKRLEIEKKYAKKQQDIAVAKSIINAAQAITSVWSEWAKVPPIAIAFSALTAIKTGIEIATIKKQKFGKGGYGVLQGPAHESGGVDLGQIGEAEGGEAYAIINRKATEKYKDKLPGLIDMLNAGSFPDIWNDAIGYMGGITVNAANDYWLKKIHSEIKNKPSSVDLGKTVRIYEGDRILNIRKDL